MFVRLPAVGVPGRLRRLALVPLMAIGLMLGLWVAPGAQAAALLGNDVSWPQCPTAVGGYGAPMPPESTQFVVVGLTKGLPFTENPCLANQVTWFRDRAKPAQAYTMAGFPTSAQLTAYGSSGPWRETTRAAQLSNVGYAEARYAVGSLAKVGWRPPVVWVDVEPRPAQPWPSTATAQRLDNRYVIEGLMRGLREAGYPYGVYSNASGCQAYPSGLPQAPSTTRPRRSTAARRRASRVERSISHSGGTRPATTTAPAAPTPSPHSRCPHPRSRTAPGTSTATGATTSSRAGAPARCGCTPAPGWVPSLSAWRSAGAGASSTSSTPPATSAVTELWTSSPGPCRPENCCSTRGTAGAAGTCQRSSSGAAGTSSTP